MNKKDPVTGDLISINLLEYAVIVVNYFISSFILKTNHSALTKDPFPMLLNWADNQTAIAWTRKAASSNASGKALSRLLCAARINNPLGLTSDFIPGLSNETADAISRIQHSPGSPPNFSHFKSQLPKLHSCRRFLLSSDFLSTLLRALLEGLEPGVEITEMPGQWQPDSDII